MPKSNTAFRHGDEAAFGVGLDAETFFKMVGGMTAAAQASELWQDGATTDLLQHSLEALLREQPARIARTDAALEIANADEQETRHGWSLWLQGLGKLYANDYESAARQLQGAHDVALRTRQSNLAMAAGLGLQLLTTHQQHAAMRQHISALQQEIDKQQALLAQQFRSVIALAIDTVPEIGTRALQEVQAPTAQPPRMSASAPLLSTQELPPLEIRLFGEFRVFSGKEEINFKQHRKPADLFKYLLAHRERAVSSDTLLLRLWPDVITSKGIHRLHLTISTLRTILNPSYFDKKLGGYIVTGINSYYLNSKTDIQIDVEQFDSLFKRGQALERIDKLEEAVPLYENAAALYTDDYLTENVYDDWTPQIRDHLRHNYVDILASLCKYYMQEGRYSEVLTAAKRILDKDEFREDAHRFLMSALFAMNLRNQALRQYQVCAEMLDQELGVKPMNATTELYLKIKNSVD